MPDFELEESHVAQTEEMLIETGEVVYNEAAMARDSVTGASGNLIGAAYNAAVNQQVGPFESSVMRLRNEIDHMSEALGMGRLEIAGEDEFNEQEFMNINPDYAQKLGSTG